MIGGAIDLAAEYGEEVGKDHSFDIFMSQEQYFKLTHDIIFLLQEIGNAFRSTEPLQGVIPGINEQCTFENTTDTQQNPHLFFNQDLLSFFQEKDFILSAESPLRIRIKRLCTYITAKTKKSCVIECGDLINFPCSTAEGDLLQIRTRTGLGLRAALQIARKNQRKVTISPIAMQYLEDRSGGKALLRRIGGQFTQEGDTRFYLPSGFKEEKQEEEKAEDRIDKMPTSDILFLFQKKEQMEQSGFPADKKLLDPNLFQRIKKHEEEGGSDKKISAWKMEDPKISFTIIKSKGYIRISRSWSF